jgi:hypothetical protein
MSLADRFLKRDKLYVSKDTFNETVFKVLREGTLIGVARSIIIDYIEKFNVFNRKGEFEIRMDEPEIKHYFGEKVYSPPDLSTVGIFRDATKNINFMQVFFPQKTIYVTLDHILSGKGNGEYRRDFSKIERSLLNWYFSFYNLYKSVNEGLIYTGKVEMTPSFPIKPLFSELNIVVAYVPVLLYKEIFTEALFRINLDILKDIVEATNENSEEEKNNNPIREEPIDFFSIKKLSMDEKLDGIIGDVFGERSKP